MTLRRLSFFDGFESEVTPSSLIPSAAEATLIDVSDEFSSTAFTPGFTITYAKASASITADNNFRIQFQLNFTINSGTRAFTVVDTTLGSQIDSKNVALTVYVAGTTGAIAQKRTSDAAIAIDHTSVSTTTYEVTGSYITSSLPSWA